MIRLLATFAALLFSFSLANASEFTASEQATVNQLVASTGSSCVRQMAAVNAKLVGQPRPPIASIMSVSEWSGYCPCVSQTLRQIVTPELLRNGTEQDGAAAIKRASTTCSVRRMKETFPAGCDSLVNDMLSSGKGASIGKVTPAAFCKCADADIEALTADNFEDFAHRTLTDYATYRRTGQVPASAGPSLLATQQKCGLHLAQVPAK